MHKFLSYPISTMIKVHLQSVSIQSSKWNHFAVYDDILVIGMLVDRLLLNFVPTRQKEPTVYLKLISLLGW